MARRLNRLTYALLWTLVFTVPFQNVVVFGSLGSLTRAVGLAVAPLGALVVLLTGRRARLTHAHVLLLLLALWIAASALWSEDVRAASVNVASTLQFLVLALLIHEFGGGPERRRGLLWAYVAGGSVVAIATVTRAVGDATEAIRFTVAGSDENALAFTLALSIPMAWYLGTTSERPAPAIAGRLYVLLAALGIVLTGSRGGTILLIIALSTVLLLPVGGRWRSAGIFLVGGLVLTALVAFVVPEGTVSRIGTAPSELTTGDVGSRAPLWDEAITVFAGDPWFGVGTGQSRALVHHASGEPTVPHNTFLTLGADTGVVGLALVGLLGLTILVGALSLPWADRVLVVMLGLVVLGTGLMSLHFAYQKVTWLIAALVATHLPAPGAVSRPRIVRNIPSVPRQEATSHA